MRKRKVKKSVLLDIVIPVFGRFDLLEKCIEHINNSEMSFDYNIILVDDVSPDKDVAREFYQHAQKQPNIFIKRNQENLGYPKSCNIGAKRKQSPLILFLNSDVFLDKQAINLMVMEFDNPKVGITGARLIFPEDVGDLNAGIRPQGKLQHIGLSCSINGQIQHPMIGWTADHPRVMQVHQAWGVTGACLMVRRSLWNKVGGFNEVFGRGTFEDAAFCVECKNKGAEIVVQPKAWGWHYTGASSETYQVPFPLDENYMKFIQMYGSSLRYSDFLYW